MEKIALFVSDIEGTLLHKSDLGYEEQMPLFFQALNEIGQNSGADKVIFSLSSTSPKEGVMEKMEELAPYMNALNIEFGNQYSETECFTPDGETISHHEKLTSKPSLMVKQASELQAEGNEVSWLGFVDDKGELYPDINNIQTEFKNTPALIIYPDFTDPLPFEHIIGSLQDEATKLGKEDTYQI